MSDDSLEVLCQDIASALNGGQLATAESCTGGMIAQACTAIAGSSRWFGFGWVSYANEAKVQMLGVAENTLLTYGAVSEQVVKEMACGARRNSGACIAVAVSGIAGPDGGTADKPVGTVWIAWNLLKNCASDNSSTPSEHDFDVPVPVAEEIISAQRFQFVGGRDDVRRSATKAALQGVLAHLQNNATHLDRQL